MYSGTTHTIKHDIVLKRKKLLTYATAEVEMKDSTLNAMSQPQKYKSTKQSEMCRQRRSSKFQKLPRGTG